MAKYSIVVPFHNEEENVTILYARLKQVMEQVACERTADFPKHLIDQA